MIHRALLAVLLVALASAGAQPALGLVRSKLMIFGGPDHDTYLGCLSCSQYDTDSVHNRYGNYGSRYASESIFNRYGDFGSRYSDYSACNPYASEPPVIVDEDGGFYGRLTLNRYHPQATTEREVLAWLGGVCGG